jgi:UDP-N-acetylmuramoyl-tripeptide--D-alanyl-D-alanine ligase
MGTNHPGEIATLTNIGRPDIAVITNCGPEHLEFLGDLPGVRRENASIIDGLNPAGLLVVNGDDADLLAATGDYPGKRVTFGLDRSNDLFATDIETSDQGVSFRLNGARQQQYFLPLLGRHNAVNSLSAIAVARRLGVRESEIREALAHARGPDMRLQLTSVNGVTVLNDAYNANPASMIAAIETFCDLPARDRRVMVLGDMLELGPRSEAMHRDVGAAVARAQPDLLICVGERAQAIGESATAHGMSSDRICRVSDVDPGAIAAMLQSGDLVLLKASRGLRLERIVEALSLRAAA